MDTEDKSSKKHKKHRDKSKSAAADGERASKKALKKQKLEQAKTAVENMSTEQRAELYRAIKTAKLMRKKVKVRGKKVTLGQLAKEVKEEEDLRSQQGVGAIDSTGRSGRKLDKVPGWELRPGAPKMQLRPEEEARLGLDLLGRGTLWSKRPWLGYFMGGLRDGGFGVYAKCGKLKQTLQQRWAGHDPDDVLVNEHFYNDIIQYGAKTELTLMAVPTRNLSLPALRKHVEQRMMQNLKILTNDHVAVEDAEALKALCGTLDSKFLAKTGFVKKDHILSGTNFIFSTNKKGKFTAEAIPPFKELKNRKTVFLWQNKSPKLTYAFWAMVLGPDAVSDDAKVNVGQGALYITNGFKFGPNPTNPNQVLITDPDNEPQSPFPVPPSFQDVCKQQAGGPVTRVFRFADPKETAHVVNSKRHAKREWKLERSRESPAADDVAIQ